MIETWKPVPNFLGYLVSDMGRVRTLKRGGDRLLALTKDRGYLRVGLTKDGRTISPRVHQVVMWAFIGIVPKDMEIRHLDGNPTNNQLSNLKYGTSSENTFDTLLHGNHNMARKIECHMGHLFDEGNTSIIKLATGSLARRCKACMREKVKQYRLAHPEEVLASQQKYRKTHSRKKVQE